jgi:hypothetical protein
MKNPKLKLSKPKMPRLKGGPELKMPKLSKPKLTLSRASKPKAPKAPKDGQSSKAPGFVNDLYRDLRDRRLLLPAVALAVALLAVPLLLRHSTDAAPPPATSANVDVSATQPAVLAEEQVGVRDYRRRLQRFKNKNPFRQQFTHSPKPNDSTASSSGGGDVLSTGTGSVSSGGTSPVDTASSAPSASVTDTPAPPSTEPEPPAQPQVQTRIITRLVTRRIDVKVGPVGSLEEMEGVRPFDILPSSDAPVVAFLGASDEGDRAAFVLSSDATPVDGDASCAPSPSNCLFITLEEGESALIDYAGDGLTYKLKLQRIRDVRVKQNG